MKDRDREVWESKLSVVYGTRLYPILRNMAVESIEERRKLSNMSLEAYLTKALLVLIKTYHENDIAFSLIWDALLKLLGEEPTDKPFESDLIEQKVTKHIVGRILGSTFDAAKKIVYRIGREYRFNVSLLERLKIKYNITDMDVAEASIIISDINEINENGTIQQNPVENNYFLYISIYH